MNWEWLLWGVAVPVVLVVVLTSIGMLLPRGHVAIVRVRLRAAPDAVWARVRDIATWGEWNAGLRRVERREDIDGDPVWAVVTRHGPIASRVTEATEAVAGPPFRLVTVICDDGLPFAGSWTWVVESDGAGSTVSLTEDGEVENPFFRFLSYVVFGTTGTAEGHLRALATGAFGEEAEPEILRRR